MWCESLEEITEDWRWFQEGRGHLDGKKVKEKRKDIPEQSEAMRVK